MTSPAWQAITAELVSARDLRAAIALGRAPERRLT